MRSTNEAAAAFLASRRVAVTGVSRTPKTHGSNNVYLKSIPGGVDAVVIGTRPEVAEETMRECAEPGIKQVWMRVIDGGCPLMFGPTADFGHKIMRLVYAGHVPKQV